jgi:exonuclease SbcC
MWQPIKIWGTGVSSLDKFEYTFTNGCTVVQGINHDDDGQESNGGGKSSFIDVPAIAILGESLLGKATKDIINWSEDVESMELGIELNNEMTNQHLIIERHLFKKAHKSELLFVKINGLAPGGVPSKKGFEGAVSVKEGNQFILESLDISKENLLQKFLISSDSYVSFFRLTGSKKMQLVQQFANVEKVDRAVENMESEQKDIQLKIDSLDRSIQIKQGSLDRLNQIIDDIETGLVAALFEQDQFERINKLKDLVAENKSQSSEFSKSVISSTELITKEQDVIIDAESMKKSISTDLEVDVEVHNSIKSEVNPYTDKKDKHDEKMEIMVRNITSSESDYREVQRMIEDINLSLKHKATCPDCKHEFSIDTNQSMDELNATLKDAIAISKTSVEDLNILKKNRDALKLKGEAIDHESVTWSVDRNDRLNQAAANRDDKRELLGDTSDIILEAERSIKNLQADIVNYKKRKDIAESDKLDHQDKILQIRSEKYSSAELELHRKNLEEVAKEILDCEKSKEVEEKEITKRKQWSINYEDFKFSVIHKRINSIAQRINYYLDQNDSDLRVIIEGFKRNRSGELRQEFTPMILRAGDNPQKYSQFSGGEKVRLDLAADLAFEEIINSKSESGGLNYYQSDELLNPVDSLGIANAAKAFDKIAKPILLVSHSGTDLAYNKRVIVEKENGISRLRM